MNLQKEYNQLTKELGKLEADLTPKSQELGELARTNKNDPSYSAAKFYNLQQDVDRLTERQAELRGQLQEVELQINLAAAPQADPAAKKQQSERDTRRLELELDLSQTRAELEKRRGNLGAAVVARGNPGELVTRINQLEAREAGLLAGLHELETH